MVAAPVLIVTSYVLFQRLVLGQERRRLGTKNIPASVSADAGAGVRDNEELMNEGDIGLLGQREHDGA